MMKTLKRLHRIIAVLLAFSLLYTCFFVVSAQPVTISQSGQQDSVSDMGVREGSLNLPCKSAVLMEATTGTVIYTQNEHEALPPASVTKIMTLLLVMEALEAGVVRMDSVVTVSANAASMGGSQVYLKEGEQMSLEDLLKSVVIASANDAAVALAEYIAGSVPSFVEKMNRRAEELGMSDTKFENVTGLDDTAENHLTSAKDIALMSKALIAHPDILQYSSIWMDTIRNGAFGLTNTNRLVRFYPGCTGLKTGSTSKAGFCVSVTAERDGFSLICVIMGAESRDSRNAIATELLDWGFANYGLYRAEEKDMGTICVQGGKEEVCPISCKAFVCVLPKNDIGKTESKTVLPESFSAPIFKGDVLGSVEYYCGNQKIGSVPIIANADVSKIGFFDVFIRVLTGFLLI